MEGGGRVKEAREGGRETNARNIYGQPLCMPNQGSNRLSSGAQDDAEPTEPHTHVGL